MSRWRYAAFFLFCLMGMPFTYTHAAILDWVSDLISTSAPGMTPTHTIQFTTIRAIPPSGRIVITPQAGSFMVPSALDYTDVDLAVATSGPYLDRTLASVANATSDGVVVTPGTSGSITFMLNASEGIAAGEKVQIRIGHNAIEGAVGDQTIANPATSTSYRIYVTTRNAANATIDTATTMIAITEPVHVQAYPAFSPPVRSNGLPSGLISAGSDLVELSLQTDELATCRYATTSGVQYPSMTGSFFPHIAQTFYVAVPGHINGTSYRYYVRCADVQGTYNMEDYEIAFSLKPAPSSNTSRGTGSGSYGSGGVGSYPGGSSVLYLASVTLSGWAPPLSQVTILKDGKKGSTVVSKTDGSFRSTISDLERGAYTFQVYVEDTQKRKSGSFSSTLTLDSGSNNTISNIVVPPTIELEKDTIETGASVHVFGKGVPGALIELSVQKQGDTTGASNAHTYTASSTLTGEWNIEIPSKDLSKGTYVIRARSIISEQSKSEFGKTLFLGVGENPSPDFSLRADINKDKKVNLVDFSILLSFWNQDNADADINSDGTVGLTDFSILLFNWTG